MKQCLLDQVLLFYSQFLCQNVWQKKINYKKKYTIYSAFEMIV